LNKFKKTGEFNDSFGKSRKKVSYTPMKVLITGITGLIGSTLARILENKGWEVYGLVRKPVSLSHGTGIVGDVLDILSLEKAMIGMDYVVHAAAVVSFAPKEREQMYKVNVEGTANVVNAALDSPTLKKLIFVSSIAAIGRPFPIADHTELTEDQKWEDSPHNSHYAISKFQAECEVWRGQAEGLPVFILNPTIVLGEGDWHRSSTQLFKYVYEERPYVTQGFLNFVDVLDVCQVILLGLESDVSGERFIVNGGQISYQHFFEKMANLFQKNPPKRVISHTWLSVLWRLEALRSWVLGSSPLITRETALSASLNIRYSSKKLQNTFDFSYLTLDQSLQRITGYFIAQQKL